MPPESHPMPAELAQVFKTYSDTLKAMDNPAMSLASVFMWLMIMALVMYLTKVRPREFKVSLLLGLSCLFTGTVLAVIRPTFAGWMGVELAKSSFNDMSSPPLGLILKLFGSIALFLAGLVIFFVGLVRAKGAKDKVTRSPGNWGPPPKA